MPHHLPDRITESKLYLLPNLMCFMLLEKYPLECEFVYNFVSPNMS